MDYIIEKLPHHTGPICVFLYRYVHECARSSDNLHTQFIYKKVNSEVYSKVNALDSKILYNNIFKL